MKQADSRRSTYWLLTAVVALNAPLVFLILLRNTKQFHFDIVSWTYMVSVTLGYYVLAILVIASVSYLILCPFRRLALGISGVLVTAAVYYLLVDSYTFGIMKMHIDLFWLKWIVSDFDAFGLSRTTLQSALVALLVLIVVEMGIFAVARRTRRRRLLTGIVWSLLPLLFVVSQITHVLAYERNDVRVTGLTPQLPLYLPVVSHKSAVQYTGVLPLGEEEVLSSVHEDYGVIHYPSHPIVCRGARGAQAPNILVLILESWRYDMMDEAVTPNIYALSQRSTTCLNHFCSGNSTVAGIFGLFYGLHPTYWPAVRASNAVIHNPVLIDVLTDKKYAFGIYAKSNFKRHKIKDAVFRDIPVHESFAGQTKVEQDADMNRQLISFVRDQERTGTPFMALAFYKSNHAPYSYPPEDTVFRPAADLNLMAAGDDTDPVEYMNDFRNATHYVDSLVGRILQELDSLGLMDRTIVVVTSDHGEEFNDNGGRYWGHGSNYTKYQIRVPLVFYAPGRSPRQLRQVTCHIDVPPTLLAEFLGCRNPIDDYSNGRNLFGPLEMVRPLVAGSYVNHAFIIGDDVYEIDPTSVKAYRLNNIGEKASAPPPETLTRIPEEMGRFLKPHVAAAGR